MHDIVQEYYGKTLQTTGDLQTSACCDISQVPSWLKPLLSRIHPEVLERYYGCGLVCPPLLDGCRVLDLGCGSGRDVYALSQLVGPTGEVIGVDMTDEQLAVARRHQQYHADTVGYDNVRFLHGYIERLGELDLAPGASHVSGSISTSSATSAGITACSRAAAASCHSTKRTPAPLPAAEHNADWTSARPA